MDRPDLYPELDEQLDLIGDPEAAVSSEMFVIDTKAKANWAIRRIGKHDAELADAKRFAKAEIERVNAWLADQQEQRDASCSLLQALLRRYHDSVLAGDPARRTVRLPAGELWARKNPDVWHMDDDSVIAWAEANDRGDLIRQADPEVDRLAVKKLFRVGEFHDSLHEADVVDPTTGEVVPGIQVVRGEDRYEVRPHGGAR